MTAHTLRYYERVGLIQPVGRARNGHRRYSEADEAWINFLHCMRATSMPIREMQRYAELREQGDATSLERRKILEDHQTGIAGQIRGIATGALPADTQDCQLPQDRAANPHRRPAGCGAGTGMRAGVGQLEPSQRGKTKLRGTYSLGTNTKLSQRLG